MKDNHVATTNKSFKKRNKLKKKINKTSSVTHSHTHQNDELKPLDSSWSFITDYNDHFETPLIAFSDLKIDIMANLLKKPMNELKVYDPYYCKGFHRLYSLNIIFLT